MIDFETKFREAVSHLYKAGQKYAKAKSTSWYMQEMRKTMLDASLVKFQRTEKASLRILEGMARNDKDYLQHVEGTRQAIEEEQKAKAELDRYHYTLEALRSLSSQETAKIKLQ